MLIFIRVISLFNLVFVSYGVYFKKSSRKFIDILEYDHVSTHLGLFSCSILFISDSLIIIAFGYIIFIHFINIIACIPISISSTFRITFIITNYYF